MTNSVSIESFSIDELLSLRDEIDARLTQLATKEINAMEKRMKRLAKYADPQIELTKVEPVKQTASKPDKTTSKRKGKKAPIKFRDPKTGDSWSGRGLTPVWLRNYEASGGDRTDFTV